jgi:DNA invertase Pin-like site-specific DNA recombinase
MIAALDTVTVVDVLHEERSAMKPGRPVFDEMAKRIKRGEAEGIISWAPDRLARNSIDGGAITYMLDTGELRDLKFVTYTFENNPQGKFMLQIMFGQSKYYSDALSENVKRGNRKKAQIGWRPNIPPVGYLNDKANKTIVPDPDRFAVVRQMWELMLTGAYTPNAIRVRANEEWGFRTRTTTKYAGGPLHLSTVHKMFSNPFYSGVFVWEGQRMRGLHDPMVTLEEFAQVQNILRKRGKPQRKIHSFAFTCIIRCGSCGLAVTAERKVNRFGSRYTYYHCTHKAEPRCLERSVTLEQLEAQVETFIGALSIPSEIGAWSVEQLEALRIKQTAKRDTQTRALAREAEAAKRALGELTGLRVRQLITDEEYLHKRDEMTRQSEVLSETLAKRDAEPSYWFEPSRAVISFGTDALSWFRDGDEEDQRLIAHAVGSNLNLKRKILSIDAKKPFLLIPKKRLYSSLLAFVRAIRKERGKSDFAATIEAIQKLERRAAERASTAECEKHEEGSL